MLAVHKDRSGIGWSTYPKWKHSMMEFIMVLPSSIEESAPYHISCKKAYDMAEMMQKYCIPIQHQSKYHFFHKRSVYLAIKLI